MAATHQNTDTDGHPGRSQNWPNDSRNYSPFLDDSERTLDSLKIFTSKKLSETTSVYHLSVGDESKDLRAHQLVDAELFKSLKESAEKAKGYEIYFINRFLLEHPKEKSPKDGNKLQISGQSFQCLMATLCLTVSFVWALTHFELPCGRGFHSSTDTDSGKNDFWYLLPVRVRNPCKDQSNAHGERVKGRDELDPFNYLHLSLEEKSSDIRGSHIAISCSYSSDGESMTAIVVNFMDGRWRDEVLMPGKRILKGLQGKDEKKDPFLFHLVYFTSALCWWTDALSYVDDQLIEFEKGLLKDMKDLEKGVNAKTLVEREIAGPVHTIAAHLQRYSSELTSTKDTLQDIKTRYDKFARVGKSKETSLVYDGLDRIASHLQQLQAYVQELKDKASNIIALLLSYIQIEIGYQSKVLAEGMKQDSISMKTVAITTMSFLPGTAFAAFLTMPFFADNKYVGDIRRIWIWVALTIPSTAVAFVSYHIVKKREIDRRNRPTSSKTSRSQPPSSGQVDGSASRRRSSSFEMTENV